MNIKNNFKKIVSILFFTLGGLLLAGGVEGPFKDFLKSLFIKEVLDNKSGFATLGLFVVGLSLVLIGSIVRGWKRRRMNVGTILTIVGCFPALMFFPVLLGTPPRGVTHAVYLEHIIMIVPAVIFLVPGIFLITQQKKIDRKDKQITSQQPLKSKEMKSLEATSVHTPAPIETATKIEGDEKMVKYLIKKVLSIIFLVAGSFCLLPGINSTLILFSNYFVAIPDLLLSKLTFNAVADLTLGVVFNLLGTALWGWKRRRLAFGVVSTIIGSLITFVFIGEILNLISPTVKNPVYSAGELILGIILLIIGLLLIIRQFRIDQKNKVQNIATVA